MHKLLIIVTLVAVYNTAYAAPSRIWWQGWSVISSEELANSMKYGRASETPHYPLSLMFDNDPTTAWVYSSTEKTWDKSQFASRHGIELTPDRAVIVDRLRLMNGQNQSRARFLRNDRVVGLRVTMDTGPSKVVRSFTLRDRMGWHEVKLPRHAVKSLKVEFTGIRRGAGPGNDVCISELALFNGNRPVNLAMPRAVMFYNGLEGCAGSTLMTRDGRELEVVANAIGYEDVWSPNGRYVSGGYEHRDHKMLIWVADAWKGKVVRRLSLEPSDYDWKDNSTLQLTRGEKKPVTRLIRFD